MYLIAVVWVGTVAIAELNKARTLRETLDKNVPESATAQEVLRGIRQARQLGYSDKNIYNSLARKFNGFIVSRELKGLGYRIAKNDGNTLAGLERALSRDAFGVQPDDLKKITLLDVGPDFGYRSYGGDTCTGFHGRVRNDLPRAVGEIGVKASFYGAGTQLIEVKKFSMNVPPVLPNATVSFEDNVRVEYLPDGWKYQLEVIEAHYVNE